MVCRACGRKGDHWTSKCPYKDLAAQVDSFTDKPPTAETSTGVAGAVKGSYVPPSMRPGAEKSAGSDMRRRNDVLKWQSNLHQVINGLSRTLRGEKKLLLKLALPQMIEIGHHFSR